MSSKIKLEHVPSPTIRGDYSTYEDRTRRNLVDAIGHVVDLRLEGMATIEIGGWGSCLKIIPLDGCKATIDDKGCVRIVHLKGRK